jgi:hypothetical protein
VYVHFANKIPSSPHVTLFLIKEKNVTHFLEEENQDLGLTGCSLLDKEGTYKSPFQLSRMNLQNNRKQNKPSIYTRSPSLDPRGKRFYHLTPLVADFLSQNHNSRFFYHRTPTLG